MKRNILCAKHRTGYGVALLMVLAGVLAMGCSSAKPAKQRGRYERAPIHEVSEEQLRTDGRLIDALSLQASDRTEEALAAYQKLVQESPDCAAAWFEMSRILQQRGWNDSAEHCARRAALLTDSNVWYQLNLAQARQRKGDAKGMIETWEHIVQLKPNTIEYYYELSNAYVAADDMAGAVEALNRVERMIGVTQPISMHKKKLWEAAGKPDKAMKEVETLADAYPADKQYNAVLAEMHMKQKRYAKAKTYYDRILKADPNDPYIHIQLAEYYKAVGKPDEADREMLLAFENKALDGRSKLQLLGAFYTDEEFFGSRSATTFRLMDMAMADCTDSTEFAAFYGHVLMSQQKYGEAVHQFELALQRDSSHYEVWELLLVSLTEADSTMERTTDYARRAAKLFPMHTLPHFLVARKALIDEKYDEAAAALDQIERWGFNKGYLEAESYSLMAEAYYRNGQKDKAWRAFDRYLALHPDDWGMLNNYAYYLAEEGLRLEEAEAMSRRTIEAEPKNASSLDTYGWILHLLGRDAEALPYLQRAVEADPKSDTLRKHLEEVKGKL